jgi:hypothetical protein
MKTYLIEVKGRRLLIKAASEEVLNDIVLKNFNARSITIIDSIDESI